MTRITTMSEKERESLAFVYPTPLTPAQSAPRPTRIYEVGTVADLLRTLVPSSAMARRERREALAAASAARTVLFRSETDRNARRLAVRIARLID